MDGQGGMQVFDSDGNMTTWYIGGTKQTFEYDESGREVEKTQWRNERVELRTRYRYKDDRLGNWIERYEFVTYPNNPQWIEGDVTYREITYFDQQ
jgi:hypothetical protein